MACGFPHYFSSWVALAQRNPTVIGSTSRSRALLPGNQPILHGNQCLGVSADNASGEVINRALIRQGSGVAVGMGGTFQWITLGQGLAQGRPRCCRVGNKLYVNLIGL